jgi:hypothetical protein
MKIGAHPLNMLSQQPSLKLTSSYEEFASFRAVLGSLRYARPELSVAATLACAPITLTS